MLPSAVPHSKSLIFVLVVVSVDDTCGTVDWSYSIKETSFDMTSIKQKKIFF